MSRTFEQAAARARAAGYDGTYGSVHGLRDMCPINSSSRRRCSCCGKRSTHVGLGNGIALMSGCEIRVRRWVRDAR